MNGVNSTCSSVFTNVYVGDVPLLSHFFTFAKPLSTAERLDSAAPEHTLQRMQHLQYATTAGLTQNSLSPIQVTVLGKEE